MQPYKHAIFVACPSPNLRPVQFNNMRVAIFLTILSTFVSFTAAAYPAAYAARAVPSKRYASPAVYAARSAPSKRYASPVEPRAVNHPSARYVNRAQPSAHYEAREPAPAPSKRASRRDVHEQTALVNIDSILCPYGMAACPVNPTPALPKSLDEWAGLEHECVEFETDLQSCGGCASIDKRCVDIIPPQVSWR